MWCTTRGIVCMVPGITSKTGNQQNDSTFQQTLQTASKQVGASIAVHATMQRNEVLCRFRTNYGTRQQLTDFAWRVSHQGSEFAWWLTDKLWREP